jgi:ribonuclease R
MSSKKKTKKKGIYLSARQLQSEILKIFKMYPKKRLNPKQVSKKLKADNNKDSIHHAMEKLVEENQLIPLGDYQYKLKKDAAGPFGLEAALYEGYVDMTRSGAAYIVCKGLEDDVYVSAKNTNTALHGDRVQVRVWTPRGRKRSEGEVVKVLERVTEHFIGTLWMHSHYALVSPDGKIPLDIKVGLDDTKGAADGDKVVVKIVKWQSGEYQNPIGAVTSVLGRPGTSDIEMKAILINNGFQLDFPESVIRESEALSEDITEEEISKRRDIRGITTFTIDPLTAKDFDDALSIRFMEDGSCEVGIHIADVSHYVLPKTELDKEAFERSTSVYLVDRVLPMLPEKLSNELCSLRPDEDKLTFSAIFTFDKNDRVVNRWFGKTIIHSNRRFTYEEAQEVLNNGEGDFANEMKFLNRLAGKLREKRFRNGSINFETEEVQFRLDEQGVPVELYVKERMEAHMLIEDFMLLANREVATYIARKGKDQEIPFVYRIHDEPDPDKVMEFARFAREMGFEMNVSNPREIAKSYNRLIKAAEKEPGLKLLEPIAIRTMAKAAYSTNNIGHYGLGFDYYSHFTSPIRRYSDVLAHRLLEKNLGNGQPFRTDKEKLEEQCGHISRQERRAMDSERESVKYKQVEFMEKHVGEVFPGFVSGIGEYGLYIELEGSRCEGMVRFDTMSEYFEVADGRLRAKSQSSGREYKMGDKVQVRITRTDLAKRQIDMALIEEEPAGKKGRRERKRK